MKNKIISSIFCTIFMAMLTLSDAFAQSFVVKSIQIEGLKSIPASTVESYLPIKRGNTFDESRTGKILRALYQTGFFDHITLSRDGSILVVHVVERPTIGKLKITGNSVIPTDKLTTVMKSVGIAEGHIYNPEIVTKIKQSLLGQYYMLGRYNAQVDIQTSTMSRNRVQLKIIISEGLVAKIKRISIYGNHVFDEKTLIKQLPITTTGLFTFFTQTDRFSEDKLAASDEALRSYYMDRGYLRFEIKSSQGEISPDRKAVFVSFNIVEGELYTLKDYVIAGHLPLSREELNKRVKVKPGEPFSRQHIIDTEKAITDYLGNNGYLYATIEVRPEVYNNTHQVKLVFVINPHKRVYVRQITFSDNTRTNDRALRREILQMEAAPVSSSLLEESKHRLSLLPYIKDVEMTSQPVEGREDQVDVNYKVKEDSSAQASAKIGYAQLEGLVYGLGFSQPNFMGTGNSFGLNFSRSRYEQFYSMDYTNPYYTDDGISRSINLSVSRVDPGGIPNLSSDYTSNQYSGSVLYGIPIGQERNILNTLQFGANYQNILLNLVGHSVSNQVVTFVNKNGRHFQELDLKAGYARNSLDRAMFPTRGWLNTVYVDLYAPLDQNSLTFYSANYETKWYQPLSEQFILLSKAGFGYGDTFNQSMNYPFFRNFYAGGITGMGPVRGYQGNTIGPKDSNGRAYGGNMLAIASVGLIFPNYLSDNLRTSAFVDAGNVYTTWNNKRYGCTTPTGQPGPQVANKTCSTGSGSLRYSVGVEADWLTPIGPIQLSFAEPLNLQKGDIQESFQFAMGTSF